MARWMAALRAFYITPFTISASQIHDEDFSALEAKRQLALSRLILGHLVLIQCIGLLFAFLNTSPSSVLLTQSLSLGYVLVCVALLFTPWSRVGAFLYVFGIFVVVAGLRWIAPGGFTVLTLLVMMLLVIFIILSGLLLPSWLIWLAMGLSIACLWVNLAFAPIALDLAIVNGSPTLLIGGFLTLVYVSVAFLTYLLARSISAVAGSALHAYRKEQELAALKDQFIIYVNHELRTPLVGLYGNLELVLKLGEQIDHSRRTLMLNRALQAGDTVLALLNSTLDSDIIRPEAIRLRMQNVVLLPLVRQIVERFDPREIGDFGLTGSAFLARDITIAIPPELQIYADPLRFQQVLTNLLSNALKYSSAGTPILISAAASTATKGTQQEHMVEIRVRDYGRGVPPQEARQLFQRFVRLQRDIASTVRGTGVGLYLCRILVEAMGGQIGVESTGNEGEGSIFQFTLPQMATLLGPTHASQLQAKALAPLFTGKELHGRAISLQDYQGKKVLLTFLRSAACPLCGVHFLHLIQQYPQWQAQGLEIIAIIESTPEVTKRYITRLQPPFPVIPDPDKIIFHQYGVTTSKGGIIRGLLLRLPVYWEAWRKRVGGRISDGDLGLLPADFLINSDLTIWQAHYGRDTGDHLGFHIVEGFAAEQKQHHD